jgi:hypothetical protein
MPNSDPYWVAFTVVQERAAAWAIAREYRRLLARPGQRPVLERWLGQALILTGDGLRRLGCRLATSCGCPDPTAALESA